MTFQPQVALLLISSAPPCCSPRLKGHGRSMPGRITELLFAEGTKQCNFKDNKPYLGRINHTEKTRRCIPPQKNGQHIGSCGGRLDKLRSSVHLRKLLKSALHLLVWMSYATFSQVQFKQLVRSCIASQRVVRNVRGHSFVCGLLSLLSLLPSCWPSLACHSPAWPLGNLLTALIRRQTKPRPPESASWASGAANKTLRVKCSARSASEGTCPEPDSGLATVLLVWVNKSLSK